MHTINEVAKLANVSVSTVSKAFNGRKDISEKTRERILEAAKELGYSPNRFAVQLAGGKEDTIGVILSTLGREDIPEWMLGIISGIYGMAELLGYRVQIFTNISVIKSYSSYIQFCRANHLMGLIVQGLDKDDANLVALAESQVPTVLIDIDLHGMKITSISADNEKACMEVIDVLAGLGHREIAFVSGSERSYVAEERWKGFKNGMTRRNLPIAHRIESNFTTSDAYDQAKNYLLRHPEVTAFFCASDSMAVGVLNACLDLRYRVPEDISIVGFDNLSFTEHTRPRLSTVAQNFYDLGGTAANSLVDLHQGKEVSSHIFSEFTVMIRESVGKNCREG